MTSLITNLFYGRQRKKMPLRNREEIVKQFHEGMGQPVSSAMTDSKLFELRWNLIREEMKELEDEFCAASVDIKRGKIPENMEALLKELADLQYVVSGFAVTYGINLDDLLKEVHHSNMSKLENGKPVYRDDGKVLKGKNYKPPYLSDLVDEMWETIRMKGSGVKDEIRF